jgi:hypothetical protein
MMLDNETGPRTFVQTVFAISRRSRPQRTEQAQRSSLRCNPSADVPRRRYLEYRDLSLEDLAPFSRGYAGNDLGSIFHAATGMKRAGVASDTLDQLSGVIID